MASNGAKYAEVLFCQEQLRQIRSNNWKMTDLSLAAKIQLVRKCLFASSHGYNWNKH